MTRCAECGAPARPHSCAELFHVVLALDHARRPPWGPLHGVTVSCFLLQHPSGLPETHRARPWAVLHRYLDGGLTALAEFSEESRRANSHRRRGAPLPDTAAGVPAPPGGPAPTAFTVTIHEVAQDGTFPAEGFADRVTAWARATIAAWQSPQRPLRRDPPTRCQHART